MCASDRRGGEHVRAFVQVIVQSKGVLATRMSPNTALFGGHAKAETGAKAIKFTSIRQNDCAEV